MKRSAVLKRWSSVNRSKSAEVEKGKRQMIKSLISAAAFSLLAVKSASAMPASSASKPQLTPLDVSDMVQTVADRRDHRRYDNRRANRYHYVPGRRYGHAPRGWHRYHSRPSFWR